MYKQGAACLAAASLLALTSGCVTFNHVDTRLDGLPLLPKDQAVRLKVAYSIGYPGRPLNLHYGASIASVDGQPVPSNASWIQVTAGAHQIGYYCAYNFQPNDTGGARSKAPQEGTYTVTAIGDWYPVVQGALGSVQQYSGSIDSIGTCWVSGFTTNDQSLTGG